MDIEKSIDAAWAGLRRVNFKRRDSRNRIGYVSHPDSVDDTMDDAIEPQETVGPSINPNEALTISSQKEFVEWFVHKKNDTEDYTRDDVKVAFEDAIGGNTGFLTTSFISYEQSRYVTEWSEFNEAGIFKKIFKFPRLCLYEIAKSCLSNAQHFSVKLFLNRVSLSKELHMLFILYMYNIMLQPRIFSTILPLAMTYISFGVMTVYSYRIILANFDLLFTSKNIIPRIAVKEDLKNFLTNYFRSKSSLSYLVFLISCIVYLLSVPVSETGSSVITAISLLFLILSSTSQLIARHNKLPGLLALFYLINIEVHALQPVILLTLIILSFVWVVYRYVGHGLGLRIWPHVFFLLWGQTFFVARQYSSLDSASIKGFSLVLLVILIIFILRNYIIHLILPLLFHVIFFYQSYSLLSIGVFLLLTILSILISQFLTKHWIYDWFLSIDPFDVTFTRVLWVGLALLLLISVVKGLIHSSGRLPPLTWDNYYEWCTPPEGWDNVNEAKYQLKCLHLAGRSVSVEGRVLSVSMKSRENAMEYYFNKLPLVYLGDGLKCLFGQGTLSKEDCDTWEGEGDEDICKYSKCAISIGSKFNFEIIIETIHRARGVSTNMKIEASNYYLEEIRELNIYERIMMNADILNPGSRDLILKLKCIQRPDGPCTSGGITRYSFIKYLQKLVSMNLEIDIDIDLYL
ncbi:Wolframin [Oopsacas minuta]|uniref:Wolframin n=1 Tax=Oopsacas minuta TaxID=111878 RepID=A0AAV7JP60_9METZ|nr:Wolframin [Oopsacas minuta]